MKVHKIGVAILLLFLFLGLFIPQASAGFEDIIQGPTTMNAGVGVEVDGVQVTLNATLYYSEWTPGTVFYSMGVQYANETLWLAGEWLTFGSKTYPDSGQEYSWTRSLEPGTAYYWRAYCIHHFPVVYEYSSVDAFTTANFTGTDNTIVVVTKNSTVSGTDATLRCSVFYNDTIYSSHNVITYLVYRDGTTGTQVLANTWTNQNGSLSTTVSGLTEGRTYQYQAYVIVRDSTTHIFNSSWYGDWESFTATDATLAGYTHSTWRAIFGLMLVILGFLAPTIISFRYNKPYPKPAVNVISGSVALVIVAYFGLLPMTILYAYALLGIGYIITKVKGGGLG